MYLSLIEQDNPLMSSAEDKMIPILGLDVWEVCSVLEREEV